MRRLIGFGGLLIGIAAVTAVFALGAGAFARPRHATSVVTLDAFVLEPSGILFAMHPTEARITISATAAAPLKVCELGTTFSTHWSGGCRLLRHEPLALPTSGGAVHVAFRVAPRDAHLTRVARLSVRWHCVDHYFVLRRGTNHVRAASPIFDC